MSVDLSKYSIVKWFDSVEKHHCGYCKSENSTSHGMWADSLTVDDYQNLIDRGWRRSGKYCYKPIMDQTCCPAYTIKCDAVNFAISKSQKKVIKKLNKFFKQGELNAVDESKYNRFIEGHDGGALVHKEEPVVDFNLDRVKVDDLYCVNTDGTAVNEHAIKDPINSSEQNQTPSISKTNEIDTSKGSVKCSMKEPDGPDPDKPPRKKAKLLRLERKREKAAKRGVAYEKTQTVNVPKTLEDFLNEGSSIDNKLNLRTRLIPTSVHSSDWEEIEQIEFELYKKYQTVIHCDPPSKLSLNKFLRFLVKSPLKPENFPENIEGPGYGSFHQQYWLDDKLIAVGVIDILPKSISSVYFFYDPDYRRLTLGTYGSLREIELTRRLQRSLPNLRDYYMGFYIHSCSKMRYKGRLRPSFLACPVTYTWLPIKTCLALLDLKPYSRLNEDQTVSDRNFPSESNVNGIRVVHDCTLMFYRDYRRIYGNSEDGKFREIAELVGKVCLKNMLFWE
ncbi:unnamed protein product [Phyllotreta striolata]|uniref:Arginyl-tRNA--protein transferase 1 n=1 Tax=Phyllotreta striolata TaxID=444603 RepID=A0A9N9TRM4_PHYSR|nr:unnamed protein product [Phyllotreta striolata]